MRENVSHISKNLRNAIAATGILRIQVFIYVYIIYINIHIYYVCTYWMSMMSYEAEACFAAFPKVMLCWLQSLKDPVLARIGGLPISIRRRCV
jgi:hypothetical protein